MINVMTLAPPLLPFPLADIAIRTLCKPLPKSDPVKGFSFNSFNRRW